MRSITFVSAMLLAAATYAAVPFSFTAGGQAKAAEVNANFLALDSALQKTAPLSKLDGAMAKLKSDSASLAKSLVDSAGSVRKAIPSQALLGTKADTSAFNPISRQVQTMTKSKQDALGFTPVNKAGDAISGKLSIEGGLLALTNKSVNHIDFGQTPVAPPSVGVRSNGTRVIWFSEVSEKYADYATGMEDYTLWNSIPYPDEIFKFKWYAGEKAIMTLDGSGGLTVNGAINGKFVTTGIPASNVADYVFEPGYKLASLSDIEAYTARYKHLPEVPSAAEIEKGGLDLAQMNLVLLKKVEELTLHAIAQQKEIESQKASFEARIQQLEAAGRR
jgi:hypothetical protein